MDSGFGRFVSRSLSYEGTEAKSNENCQVSTEHELFTWVTEILP